MTMRKYVIGLWLAAGFLLSGADCGAQTIMTLDSCIQRALEANYSIRIVRNQHLQWTGGVHERDERTGLVAFQ